MPILCGSAGRYIFFAHKRNLFVARLFTLVKCLFTWKKKTSNLYQFEFQKNWQTLQKLAPSHSTGTFKDTCVTYLSKTSCNQVFKNPLSQLNCLKTNKRENTKMRAKHA